MAILNHLPYLQPPSRGFEDLMTSDAAGWRSLGIRLIRSSANQDQYETAPHSDLAIHVPLHDVIQKECFASGRWRSFEVHQGLVAITPPAQTWRIRYLSKRPVSVLHANLYVPLGTLESVAEELPFHHTNRPHSLVACFTKDEMLAPFALSVMRALKEGVSDAYAQASAQWLSTHLLLNREQFTTWLESLNTRGVSDLKLERVLEYIRHHIGDDLGLQVLAREAGLSTFQFATLFRRSMNKSAHKHVTTLRMQNAAKLLGETRKSCSEIALLCGYKTASHFGVAFVRYHGATPLEYRFAQKRAKWPPDVVSLSLRK